MKTGRKFLPKKGKGHLQGHTGTCLQKDKDDLLFFFNDMELIYQSTIYKSNLHTQSSTLMTNFITQTHKNCITPCLSSDPLMQICFS